MKKLYLQNKDIPLPRTTLYRKRIRETNASSNSDQNTSTTQEKIFQLKSCEHFQETSAKDSTDKFLDKNEMRTSENSGFQSDSDIDEDCPNQNIYITSESSDDSDFLYDDSLEESLD